MKEGVPLKPGVPQKTEIPRRFEEQVLVLSHKLQAKVKLKPGQSGQGSLVIHYKDMEALERMMNLFVEQTT